MAFFDTLVTVPNMTWADQRAAVDDARTLGFMAPVIQPGGRMRTTIRTLIALRLWSAYYSTAWRYRIPMVEPWAIPSPWTEWRGYSYSYSITAPMDAGLYFVSDRVPDSTPDGEGSSGMTGGRCGYAMRVVPTAASPSVSVAMSDATTWTPVIPANTGPTFVILETDASAGTVTASGCSTTLIPLYWPLGILVDPDPANWLAGYDPVDSLPVAPVSLPAKRNQMLAREVPYSGSWISYLRIAQEAGRAGIPRPMRDSQHSDSLEFRSQPAHWTIATATGLKRQTCGPDSYATPTGLGGVGAATRYATYSGSPLDANNSVVMSAPASLLIYNPFIVSFTLDLYERTLSGSAPGSVIATLTIPAGPGAQVVALPTASTLTERRAYTTEQTTWGASYIPNVHHALPFSVVASDGTVIPAGQASAFLEDVSPIVTDCVPGVPTGSAAERGTYRWSGLTAGIYEIPSSVLGFCSGTIATSDGRVTATSTTAQIAVPAGGSVELHLTFVSGSPAVVMNLLTPSPVTLALGDNATWPGASWGVGEFTAAATGTYRFAFTGTSFGFSRDLIIGSDASVSVPTHTVSRGVQRQLSGPFPAYPPTPGNTPTTSGSYVGLRSYLIGSAPTGDWAGHAGEMAWGVVQPGTIVWQFADLPPGTWYSDYRWNGTAWENMTAVELGHVDIPLSSGQTIYTRIVPAVSDNSFDQPHGAARIPDSAPSGTITITAL